MPTLLTTELLEEWTARQRAAGMTYLDAWRPGLTNAEIAAIESEHQIVLPTELRTWWGWHDGVAGRRNVSGADLLPFGLAEAIAETNARRQLLRDYEAGHTWPASDAWINLGDTRGGDRFCAELTEEDTARIRLDWVKDVNEESMPTAPSLGTLIEWWIDAINDGTHWFDDEHGLWLQGYNTAPLERRKTALV